MTSKRVSYERLHAAAVTGVAPLAAEALAKHDCAMAEIAESTTLMATPAVERAAEALRFNQYPGQVTKNVQAVFAAALDIDELTEVLAREQWNHLYLVASGQMVEWDDETVTDRERESFRDRCRPFAEAIRASILGGAA